MKRLFGNIGWLLGGRGVNALLSLVYLALATRALGTVGFGQFALIVALGQAITGLANFQTWQFIVRWGANGDGDGVDPAKAAEATGFAMFPPQRPSQLRPKQNARSGTGWAPRPVDRKPSRRVGSFSPLVFFSALGVLSL